MILHSDSSYFRKDGVRSAHMHRQYLTALFAITTSTACHGVVEECRDNNYVKDGCPRNGTIPSVTCVSWEDGACRFDAVTTPEWATTLAAAEAGMSGLPVCTPTRLVSCVNVTNSARTLAAMACEAYYADTPGIVLSEMSSLQLRVHNREVEVNVIANQPSGNHSGIDLALPKCSAAFAHTCERASTGFVFHSKFTIRTGTGLETSLNWRNNPTTVLSMEVGELGMWEATCSKSSLSVVKRHYFKAGRGMITYDEKTLGRSKKTVYPRCVTQTTFVWDALRRGTE